MASSCTSPSPLIAVQQLGGCLNAAVRRLSSSPPPSAPPPSAVTGLSDCIGDGCSNSEPQGSSPTCSCWASRPGSLQFFCWPPSPVPPPRCHAIGRASSPKPFATRRHNKWDWARGGGAAHWACLPSHSDCIGPMFSRCSTSLSQRVLFFRSLLCEAGSCRLVSRRLGWMPDLRRGNAMRSV